MKRLHLVEAGSAETEAQRFALPEHVQLSLVGIAESAKQGLLALAVGAGLAVLHECMEHEVERVIGPRGRHDPARTGKRHGHTAGEVTLGGRRVPVSRPRVRTADDAQEIGLESYAKFGSRDLLERVALERMLAGISTRRYGRAAEPVGAEVEAGSRSTSRSAISRAFVAGTREALHELLSRDLRELELAVVMIDGIELAGMTHVVALGISSDGTNVPLSLREGSTENAIVATARCSPTWSIADCRYTGLLRGPASDCASQLPHTADVDRRRRRIMPTRSLLNTRREQVETRPCDRGVGIIPRSA